MLAVAVLLALPAPAWSAARDAVSAASFADAAAACRRVGNDDRVRPYTPSFRPAFNKSFADDGRLPNAATLKTGVVRCMGGRLFGCIIGANQPCDRMNVARRNAGADSFCRDNPDATVVPLAASGHDSLYDYACAGSHAVVTRTQYRVDARGFAVGLWRPLD